MKRDEKIFDLIRQEKERQMHGIELIASENFVSEQVLEAMGSVMTNKYAEGYPGKRYYGGCQIVDQSEQIAIDRACQLFNATFANVQPHSGAQANMAVMQALLEPGDTFMGLDLSHGGHLSHGSPVNASGMLYKPVAYHVAKETGRVDYDEMEKIALECKPKLIIAGASAYSRDWDYKRMRAIADQVGAVLMADVSHPAGLIAKGLLNDPLEYCHIITTTTHKTLRGPRGGMILIRHDFEDPRGRKTPKGETKMMSALINSAVFPGIQGGPLEHVIASKAVAFGEALSDEYKEYILQVKKNASVMAQAFVDKGYPVILGEYGANWREFSNSSIQKKHDASIRLFHRTINEEAIKRGIIPYVWDINNPNRYGTGGIMCIIDRSKPAVFDQNSLDGIMEGAAAATWGGPTASIRHTVSTTSQSAGQYYTLTGLRVAADTKGLLITGGKKIIIK